MRTPFSEHAFILSTTIIEQWSVYTWRMIGVVTLVFLQTLLIALLLLNRAKRRRAEEELRLSETRFRDMADTSSVMIWIADTNKLCTYFNRTCMDFTGRTFEQLLGEGWLETVHEEDRDRCIAAYSSGYERREPFVLEYRILNAAGEFRWLYSTGAPRFASEGEFLGYIGSAFDITDRKLAEEAVRESEKLFRHMADSSAMLIWMSGTDPLVTFVNKQCMDFTGLSKEAMLGERWLELIHEEDRQRCIDIYIAAYERREPFVYEYRIRHADGEFHWLYSTSAPRFASDGEFLGYIGSCVDITDRKLVEEAVRESETLFRHMADSSAMLIWTADENMLCTYFNQRVLDFTGRNMEELCGEGWLEIVHEDDVERCVETYVSGYESKKPFILEYRLRRADDEFRWLYDTGVPRFASNREFLGYIGSAVDITDRRNAEQALQIAHAEVSKLKNQLEAENVYLQEEIKLAHSVDDIVGESHAIKYVLFKIAQVSQTDTTALILGETGTGKELVARAIHNQSGRKDRPLVKLNCAALSASLIESELFGHEKGAFTGAQTRKIGRFELADGATLFLDEIGELPLELQPKLLRVVQEGEFERLGGTRTIKVDVRLLAATNRNLKDEVEKGTFREDLWYRLNVFPLTVPPLRQRKEDIPAMVEHFVRAYSRKVGKTITSISSATLRKLNDHSWPGNVRELANVIERAVVNAQGPILHIADQFEQSRPEKEPDLTRTLEEIERDYIIRVLDSTGWKVRGDKGAALVLGLNPSTLRTRMLKLGIQKRITTALTSGSRVEPSGSRS
jgi:PAS domain S-box-containing protein